MDDCKCDQHFEITCVDKCLELAQKAEDLFDEASRCECKAKELMEKARECEKSSNVLAAKANDLREKKHNATRMNLEQQNVKPKN